MKKQTGEDSLGVHRAEPHDLSQLAFTESLIPSTFESGQASIHYAVSTPDNYTDSYTYPLVIWFHDDGGSEQDVLEWMPRLSPQNYVGLGLRGPLPSHNGAPGQFRWSWGPEHLQWAEDQLSAALFETCQRLSLHSERIVTAGIGRGATMALLMMLRRPDVFRACACLNADFPQEARLDWYGQYVGRSLWLGHSEMLEFSGERPAISQARLFHATGMEVTPRFYSPDEWPEDTLASELDHWLMHTLCGDTVIV